MRIAWRAQGLVTIRAPTSDQFHELHPTMEVLYPRLSGLEGLSVSERYRPFEVEALSQPFIWIFSMVASCHINGMMGAALMTSRSRSLTSSAFRSMSPEV